MRSRGTSARKKNGFIVNRRFLIYGRYSITHKLEYFYDYSGESMENALRACCKGIKIGKILIHRESGDNGKQVSLY